MLTLPRARPRSRRDIAAAVLVGGGLAAYVVLVYVVVVVGGGELVGHSSSPSVVLSIAATAILALSLGAVQARLEGEVSRALQGGRLSPYETLRRAGAAATAPFPTEALPARMARLLADGVGAEWVQVWLAVEGGLDLAATWPVDAPASASAASTSSGRRMHDVRQAGELLGVLVVQERPGVPLTPVEERLFAGLADQAGVTLRGVRLRAEMARRADQLGQREIELRESRERLVDAHDAERRRLERDIHDGAQQHLVALAVSLRLAHTLLARAPDRAARLLVDQERAVVATIETLVSLARGIYPRRLSETGLVAALEAATVGNPLPTRVVDEGVGRLPAVTETTGYFCALEAVQNAAKHSSASAVVVTVGVQARALCVTVEDDGIGFDVQSAHAGTGLSNIRDRVEAVGGALDVVSTPGRTVVALRLPLPASSTGVAV